MGDIEGSADLVKAIGLAILRQFPLDLHPRNIEEVANGVFIFISVQPS